MKQHLKKLFYLSLATLMIIGTGISAANASASLKSNRYGIDVFPSRKTHQRFAYQLRKHGHNGRIYYASKNSKLGHAIFGRGVPDYDYANYMARHQHRLYKTVVQRLIHQYRTNARRRFRKARVKRYNRKVRRNRQRTRRKQRIFKARFKRSNNRRALKRSGFYDARSIGGHFIFDKYAPNDRRAIVSKQADVNNWYQGEFGQKHPVAYYHIPKSHGWLKLN